MGSTIEAAAASDQGRVRELNEDLVLATVGPGGGLLAVADGMGGHQAGEVASRLALDSLQKTLRDFLSQPEAGEAGAGGKIDDTAPGITNHLEKSLLTAVTIANKTIFDYAQEHQEEAGNMGCTLTAALIRDDLAVIANIGDSRAYLLRDGKLTQITEDHSYVGELARAGQISPEEIYDHPQRNVITRALGSHHAVEADTWTHALQPGDQLLLCSDGLWEMLRDPLEIRDIMLTAEDTATAVGNLIEAANAEGGVDNIGLVVAKFQAA